MKNFSFLENTLNSLPTALLVGALLLFLPRLVFNTDTNSLLLLTIQATIEFAGVYIIVVALYRKIKSKKKQNH